MAFRHRGPRSRAGSSGSSSRSASASPSTVPALNFTLYGAPAPRSAYRTSSGAANAKPRRRSTRPTAGPPASPLSTCCTDDFRLDLSSLAADEFGSVVISRPNGSELCCIDDEAVTNESGNQFSNAGICAHAERTDDNGGSNANDVNQNLLSKESDNIQYTEKTEQWFGDIDSEGKPIEDRDLSVNTGSSSTGSEFSDTDKTSSDFISSSQAFSDERASSVRSCLSGSSSYVTLSEYSADSCSSKCLYNSRESRFSNISISSDSQSSNRDLRSGIRNNDHVAADTLATSPRKKITADAVEQLTRRFPNENISLKPQNTKRKKLLAQRSSGVISNRSRITESPVTVPPRDKDNACLSEFISVSTESSTGGSDSSRISCALRKGHVLNTKATDPTTNESRETSANKKELIENQCITNDQSNDNEENKIIDVCRMVSGHSCLNKGHENLSNEYIVEEGTITDQVRLCCARSMKICNYVLNCSVSGESRDQAVPDPDTYNVITNVSRNESCIGEKSDQSAIAMEMLRNKTPAAEEEESLSSGLDSRTTSQTSVSRTNMKNNDDLHIRKFHNSECEFQQLSSPNNKEFVRNVYSVPTGPQVPKKLLQCDCESGGRTRFLLERLECGCLPNVSASDIPLSGGEFTEAILHARQLVRVLERALDRALSLNTDRTSTESSLEYVSTIKRKQRSSSLSPNILRRCKRIDSMCSSASTKSFLDMEDRVLGPDTGVNYRKGLNAEHTSDVKPPVPCDSVSTRRWNYGDEPYMLYVSPEQLQKQRALLKPVAERRLHGSVVQVFNMADILKNAITRRRKFMDPSEEFTCGTNRSVSEWSLEGSDMKL